MHTFVVLSPTEIAYDRLRSSSPGLRPYEVQRARSFVYERERRAYLAAHLLVRHCAEVVSGTKAREVMLEQTCTACGGPHGAPRLTGLAGVSVSLSHSGSWVMASASQGRASVDIEAQDAEVDINGVSSMLTESERRSVESDPDPSRAALRLWTRKECLVKLGLFDLDEVAVWDVRHDVLLQDGSTVGFQDVETTGVVACIGRHGPADPAATVRVWSSGPDVDADALRRST